MTMVKSVLKSWKTKIMTVKVIRAILIALLALFLRTYLARIGLIEHDEHQYAKVAVDYSLAIRTGHWDQILTYSLNAEHPIFNKLLYAVALLPFKPIIGGNGMVYNFPLNKLPYYHQLLAMRLVSVTAGTIITFILSLINPLAGLAFAVDTFAIKYSSVIYLEAFPLLASLVALLAAEKAFKNSENGKGHKFRWLILSSVAMGMAIASKYMYGVVGLAIPVGLLIKRSNRNLKSLSWMAGWGLLCIFFFFLFDPFLWLSPISRLQWSIMYFFNYPSSPYVISKAYPIWQPLIWLLLSIPNQYQEFAFSIQAGDYFVLGDTLIFILAVVGIPDLCKKNILMACWLLLGIIFLLFWGTKWPQYVMLVLPPLCLSAAFGANIFKDLYFRVMRLMRD
ncbi:MAG TPA: hypothetical protein VKF38_03260 [Anaerolineaceae bacterium]|nr:hypothetical protein [Anaerolineaceae bacterium]